MSSFVFYRFKSQKEPSRISFDGQSISVWDLKKEIIMENKMGKGGDFDFAIYREDTEEGEWLFSGLPRLLDHLRLKVLLATRCPAIGSFFEVPYYFRCPH